MQGTRRLLATLSRALSFVLLSAAPFGFIGCGGGGGSATPPAAAEPPFPALKAADLAVLIADGDATSLAIARAYQQARGVPEANLIRVSLPRDSDVISAADFVVLKANLDARLPASVQATLLTWTRPSRVTGPCTMSLTSALALGFDTRYCGGCAATAASPYFDSPSSRPWTELRVRPSMMLGANTLAQAQALIDRGVAADGSWLAGKGATGQAILVRTNDSARSVRYPDFQVFAANQVSGLAMRYIDNAQGTGSNFVSGESKLMFYFTGLVSVPQLASNRFLPGAVGDHLTSQGGVLPDGAGQMPATDWLAAGATASYGTVEEPCNFSDKFPQVSVLLSHYRRGETLIEAYWKSVRSPGQGLFVGEPLARPWGR